MALRPKVRRFVLSHNLPEAWIDQYNTLPTFNHLKSITRFVEKQNLQPALIGLYNTPERFTQLKSNVRFRDRLDKYTQAHPHAAVDEYLPNHWQTTDREVRFKQLQLHTRKAEQQQRIQRARDLGAQVNNRIGVRAVQQAIADATQARVAARTHDAAEHVNALLELPSEEPAERGRVEEGDARIRGYTHVYRFHPPPCNDLRVFEVKSTGRLYNAVRQFLLANPNLGVKFILSTMLQMEKNIGVNTDEEKYHTWKNSHPHIAQQATDIRPAMRLAFQRIEDQMEAHNANGSGSTLINIQQVTVSMVIYQPMHGASYIELPEHIKNKQACVNVINDDQECFKWAVISAVFSRAKESEYLKKFTTAPTRLPKLVAHPERTSTYKDFQHGLDFTGIEFPVKVDQITRFEINNPQYAITVAGFEIDDEGNPTTKLWPMRTCRAADYQTRIPIVLLYYSNAEGKSHYVWVKKPNALVGKRKTTECTCVCACKEPVKGIKIRDKCICKDDQNKHKCKCAADKVGSASHVCHYCLSSFTTPDALQNHTAFACNTNSPSRVTMPTGDALELKYNKKAFTNGKTPSMIEQQVPFYIVADFESKFRQVKVDPKAPDAREGTDDPKPLMRSEHDAVAIGYQIICANPELTQEVETYHETDEEVENTVSQYFVRDLQTRVSDWIDGAIHGGLKFLETHEGPLQTICHNDGSCRVCKVHKDTQRRCLGKGFCHICEKFTLQEREAKQPNPDLYYVDTCPFTGKTYGVAHKDCITRTRLETSVPVLFHNGNGYDSHFILKELSKASLLSCKQGQDNVTILPCNEEKVMTYSIGRFRFCDTMLHLKGSLESLSKQLPSHPNLEHEYGPHLAELLKEKVVFPYEKFTSFEFLEQTEFPPIEDFYSTLTNSNITEEEWKHGKKVYEALQCDNMGEYMDHYLRADVLILADVWGAYRDKVHEEYGLDPCHFISQPGLSWHALLKQKVHDIELIAEQDKYEFYEGSIRGGVSTVSHRYAQATCELILWYLDATNLYGWSMIQKLPVGEYKWVSDEWTSKPIEQAIADINALEDNGQYGYTFEFDIHYPEHLHDLHNDYPLFPSNRIVDPKELSPTQRAMYCKSAGITDDQLNAHLAKNPKLIGDLNDKFNQRWHFRNLKFALRHGLVLTKIHRVMRFKQAPWMRGYVEGNTAKRKEAKAAKDKVADSMYKAMTLAPFGGTMMNVRGRTNVRMLATDDEKGILKMTRASTYKKFININEDVNAFMSKKASCKLNRPIATGSSILDLSKLWMWEFWYDFVKPTFGDRATLCYTDTDSFIILIKDCTDEDRKKLSVRMDMSNYPKDHPLYSTKNAGVLGMFKDELEGGTMVECVGLRSKSYSGKKDDGTAIMRSKGTPTRVLKQLKNHENYVDCVKGGAVQHVTYKAFQSKNHVVSTVDMKKKALDPFDSKRWICEDGISTLAYGHYRIPK